MIAPVISPVISPEAIAEAARSLRAGALVAFPTETVYGLGADAGNDRAVARVFAAKGRPRFNPLIVHVPDFARAAAVVAFDDRARDLAARFWPGPLSLVLPRRADAPVSPLAGAGLDTLAVRVPANDIARALIEAAGAPVAAPSANPAGGVSPTRAGHVAAALGGAVEIILDGGPCAVGLESTVIDLSTARPVLLRPGGVALEDLTAALGPIDRGAATDEADEAALRSPGRLASHYAPRLPLRIDAATVRPGEALLSFGPHALTGFAAERNLSVAGDPVEAAANLFAMLRELDRPEYSGIVAMPAPEAGLGRAIMDRLRRAAAPRPLAASGGAASTPRRSTPRRSTPPRRPRA